MESNECLTRRKFLKSTGLIIGAAALPWGLKYSNAAAAGGPQLEQGIQIGDVQAHRAVIWSRSDRPARLLVDYDLSPSFFNPTRIRGPFALETTDYTARVDLTGLPDDREIFVQVMFEDLSNARNLSEPVDGHFRTASQKNRVIRFCGAVTLPARAGA